ncbi:ACT domain-containing protein [uncultured Microbulbifer sp.]|uniref:ACT domain-containing protein n=1 Tax=uncultured Microbulbifer sp. TaxID=348147 RepID=UPI0025F704E9|nr:ACT domain-containing protein [uncultured Microbulbifer sp.]
MNAQVQIDRLLQRLSPILNRQQLALCPLEEAQLQDLLGDCLSVFREREGLCALLPAAVARERGLRSDGSYRQITLHCSQQLPVPGLAAAVVRALAEAGLHASMVSARCHEHILVREEDTVSAMQVLNGISNRLQYS